MYKREKLIWKYDHRFATYEGSSDKDKNKGNANNIDRKNKLNLDFKIKPRRWLPREKFIKAHKDWINQHH